MSHYFLVLVNPPEESGRAGGERLAQRLLKNLNVHFTYEVIAGDGAGMWQFGMGMNPVFKVPLATYSSQLLLPNEKEPDCDVARGVTARHTDRADVVVIITNIRFSWQLNCFHADLFPLAQSGWEDLKPGEAWLIDLRGDGHQIFS